MQFNYKFKYLVIIIILISGYFFLFFSDIFSNEPFCIFKNITGLPCPSCGSIRATLLLFHGEFLKSVSLNPFGLLSNIMIMTSIFWMFMDIKSGRESFLPFLKRPWNPKIMIVIMMIAGANWIWNIVKGL